MGRRRAWAAVAGGAIAALLSGCVEPVRQMGSIKDDTPRAEHGVTDRAKADLLRPEMSVEDRAKAEQAARCGQRHIEYRNGTLRESEDEKRLADTICVELHKYDYVGAPTR
jgi:hypothetical protein